LNGRATILVTALLLVVVAYLFRAALSPETVLFANDGPLGVLVSASLKMPDAYGGMWNDLTWLGAPGGNGAIGFTYLLLWALGPVGFAKFYVPFSLVILGLCAFYFFRKLGLPAAACILAALAAALNSNFFSNACWGLATRGLSLAAAFLALAAVHSSFGSRSAMQSILKAILAGLAIGLSIAEGGDNGAIFSLFIASYAFYGSLLEEGPAAARVVRGGIKVAIMAGFAAIMAAQTLFTFVIKDVQGTTAQQSNWSKERQWSWATQWSLPKLESLRVVVPGLFGYRLDTPAGGDYWGGVGQEPGWEEGHKDPAWMAQHPGAFPRHSGAGEYAGVLVVLVALWGVFHSFVPQGGSYSLAERRFIWFWAGAAFVALLLAWGRHAPFYRVIYELPYFSTIRNPMKFMHPCHMAVMILFAYGLQGLWRRYLEAAPAALAKLKGPAAPRFEKRWLLGSAVGAAVMLVAWVGYASAQSGLVRHLQDLDYPEPAATAIARFSAGEVGSSAFFLLLSVGALLAIARGVFAPRNAHWAGVVLGIILIADLCRANTPWIKYYDYKSKYAMNGVLQVMADKPYEHRVSMPPLQYDRNYAVFQQVYAVEWLQHQFPYYNIQSIDQPQDPRPAADKAAYREALATNIVRLWELTNTRYLLGMAGPFADVLNQQLDPGKRRFHLHTTFTLSQDPAGNIGARVEPNGPFGLIEFTGALPRAGLYARWQVNTNNDATLARLISPEFDPAAEVLVSNPIASPPASGTNTSAGTVEFASYAPKRIQLNADVAAPAVLLLNDRWDPQWNVRVDGRPASLLRCNFCMRGVQLEPGRHVVEFRYQPRSTAFRVSLAVTLFGLLLCGGLIWVQRRNPSPTGA
jgi:hypothetical protein